MSKLLEIDPALPLTVTTSHVTVVSVPPGGVSADAITVRFDTLPNNNPETRANALFIWQNSNEIPWSQPWLHTHPITTSTPDGTWTFDGLNVTQESYIVGYGVGGAVSDICSTVFIPAIGGGDNELFQTTLSNVLPGSTNVTFQYNTPTGYHPAASKNWVGLWRGTTASYTTKPYAYVGIKSDNNIGTTGINDISLGRGLSYTLAYFMGSGQSAMACTCTFTVGS